MMYSNSQGGGGAWDSGTLTCDMNNDGSRFRLQGAAYVNSANSMWDGSQWIPGTSDTYAGLKTFKVKKPSDGVARWIWGAGIHVNVSNGVLAGNLNYDTIIIGTDGFLYVMCTNRRAGNTEPINVNHGIEVVVDECPKYIASQPGYSGYVVGNGA